MTKTYKEFMNESPKTTGGVFGDPPKPDSGRSIQQHQQENDEHTKIISVSYRHPSAAIDHQNTLSDWEDADIEYDNPSGGAGTTEYSFPQKHFDKALSIVKKHYPKGKYKVFDMPENE